MKKRIFFLTSLAAVLFVFTGTILAETYTLTRTRNQNQNQYRRLKQNSACQNVLMGTPATYEGVVTDVSPPGTFDGMTILTADGPKVVYGLGPVSYWDANEVDRPSIGDQVSVDVRIVSFTSTARNILMELNYIGENVATIVLRDPATGCPMWRPAPNQSTN